eukprot:336738_1
MLFERFKMALYDRRDTLYLYTDGTNQNKANDDDEKSANRGRYIDIHSKLTADNGREYSSELVFIEAFKFIQKESKEFLRKKKMKFKKEQIQWIVTVPAIWSNKAKHMMKQWIIKAGLVDANDRTQCKIVYE